MKRVHWLGLVTGLLIFLIAWGRDRATYSYDLTGVSEVVCQGEAVYILDNKGDSYNLFSTTWEGEITGSIKLDKLDGVWWNTYSHMSVDEDGQVYVYNYRTSMDMDSSQSLVYRCDFENKIIQPMWELPDDNMIRIQVIRGDIYYMASEKEGKTGFYRQKTAQEGDEAANLSAERLYLLDVKFHKVKSYYYKPDYGILWADWNSRFYLNNQEVHTVGTQKRDYVSICAWQGGILFTDMASKTIERVPWEIGPNQRAETLCRIEQVSLWNQELEHLDIFPFHIEDSGSWTAGIDISASRRIVGMFDKDGQQTAELSHLTQSMEQRIETWIKTVCLCIVMLIFAGLLMKLGLFWSKGTIPIIVQLLGVLIPVIIITCMLLNRQIEKSLEERIIRMDYDLLYIMADQKLSVINPEDLKRMDIYKIPEDPIYQNIWEMTDYSTLLNVIYNLDVAEEEPVIIDTYHWMYLLEDGALRYARISGQHYYGGRVAYDRSSQELEKMERAMTQKQTIKTEYNDFSGDFVALYVPIMDERGMAIGVLESGLNRRMLTYEIEKQMGQIRTLLFGLVSILIIVLMVVLGFFLYPLTRIKAAVEEVSQGNLGKVVTVGGKHEVAEIASAFNHMSGRLKEQVTFIQACSDGYGTFVPQKVFEILERTDITQVKLGDQKEIQAAVLDISSSQFRVMAKSMNGEALYGMINRILQEMIPIITEESGIVDHMVEDGLTAFYPDRSKQALQSAISICERLNWLRSQGEQIPIYRSVVSYGIIRVGIVGQEKRMAASTISEIMTLSSFLREIGEKYGSRVLITESAVKQIPEFAQRFHARMIGYLYLHISDSMEAIYDVYDGDEAVEQRDKEDTQELFWEALSEYLAGNYYDARLKFAQVLRRNSKDLVARAYVYRCDEYYQSGNQKVMDMYLEQY